MNKNLGLNINNILWLITLLTLGLGILIIKGVRK